VQSTPFDEGTGGGPAQMPTFGAQTVGQPADYYGANSVNPNTGGGSFAGGQQMGGVGIGSNSGNSSAFPLQGQYGIVKMAEGGMVPDQENVTNSLNPEISASQVIMKDLGRKASPEEVQKLMEFLVQLNEQGKLFMLKENNTVAVLISIGEGIVEAHLFSVDSPLTMARSLKIILDELKRSHLKRMYSNVDEDTHKTLALVHKFGVETQQSDKPEYIWMADL
jgi:hypothetical protein